MADSGSRLAMEIQRFFSQFPSLQTFFFTKFQNLGKVKTQAKFSQKLKVPEPFHTFNKK